MWTVAQWKRRENDLNLRAREHLVESTQRDKITVGAVQRVVIINRLDLGSYGETSRDNRSANQIKSQRLWS